VVAQVDVRRQSGRETACQHVLSDVADVGDLFILKFSLNPF
jgi:hypothetical protein